MPQRGRGSVVQRDDARANATGCLAFLAPPAALVADATGRDAEPFSALETTDLRDERARLGLEVLARVACARPGEPKHFRRVDGAGERDDVVEHGQRPGQVANSRRLSGPLDDAEDDGARLVRLGARAKRVDVAVDRGDQPPFVC